MSVYLAASVVQTCFGDGEATFAQLLQGACGVGPLRFFDAARVRVTHGYHIADDDHEIPQRAHRWVSRCVERTLRDAGIEPARQRTMVIVGTGLGGLREVERAALGQVPADAEALHFASAIRARVSGLAGIITLSNACSASGHALGLAQDLLETGEADVVVAAGADSMTASMVAMIGRFAEVPTERVRPFDQERGGVLLGDAAAAAVLTRKPHGRPLARVVATAMTCDAHHETQPDRGGIERAIAAAFLRAEREPEDIELVVAHGTGTALNDPCEASALAGIFGKSPLVTGVKGAVGHTSGTAALINLDVAVRAIASEQVPPVVGLVRPIAEAEPLSLVLGKPVARKVRRALINAFGFGGVNTISLVEAP